MRTSKKNRANQKRLTLKSIEPLLQERAYQYALRLLASRDYTTLKLREKLRARAFPDAVAESVVTRLAMEGWVNDRRFAERVAEAALSTQRFFGPRLKLELRRRGVAADLIEDVLGQIRGEYDEVEGVRSLLEKRFPGFSFSASDDREKHRVIGFLQRRGFGFSAIMKVLRQQI